jgi:hypothetical protein
MARVEDLTPLGDGSPVEAAMERLNLSDANEGMRTGNTGYGSQARERRLQTYLTAAAGAHSKRKFRAKELLHRKEQMAEAKRQFDESKKLEQSQFSERMAMERKRDRNSEPGFLGSLFGK